MSARGLGKRFRLYRRPLHRLPEWLTLGRVRRHVELWAVRDVSLEARSGEVLGVLGPNGSGKTTLLRLLSGVLHPTEGSCAHRGRLLPVLGLGASLNPELTGEENATLYAESLDLPDRAIRDRMGAVREFSELADFFRRPVSCYSHGMRTRLLMSVVATLDADVIMLDEALGGSDQTFRERVYRRIEEMVVKGAAVVLTSHDPGTVRRLCRQVLVLHQARVAYHGVPEEGLTVLGSLRREGPMPAPASLAR